MFTFDGAALRRRLDRVHLQYAGALALACAARHLDHFRALFADLPGHVALIDDAHAQMVAVTRGTATIEPAASMALSELILTLYPDDDSPRMDSEHWPGADDSMCALVYVAMLYGSGDRENTAWALQRGYDCVDAYAQRDARALGIDATEPWLLAHPLVQQELGIQHQQLDAIERAGMIFNVAVVDALLSS